jgi:hypothetical protein
MVTGITVITGGPAIAAAMVVVQPLHPLPLSSPPHPHLLLVAMVGG